ncbi:unnamed protein product [Rotaria socialis]|uniref:Uncharacterized protein n=1 Tax=Rotaria socialis TaxID=392032 RepID=A0A817XD23_9BILA|nr:unnamed protein product [Rotaria socialis]CAF3723066.1 unnamed protein product [Rotaria socialis]CAF4378503.1 unnamed protein product [Rotaria socialis]CAF4486773.1 unnamed protein product [Rotaria socialis]
MEHLCNTHMDRLSEEAHGNILSGLTNDCDVFTALGIDPYDPLEDFQPDFIVSGTCDLESLTKSMKQPDELLDSATYIRPKTLDNVLFGGDNNFALMKDFFDCNIDTMKEQESNTKQIDLSPSVGVRQNQISVKSSPKIQICYPLEQYYRPRYKSDYFTHDGKIRRPRYVADGAGNHFVALQVPPGIRGMIRIDWLTVPTENGDQYFMPYCFQQNNESQEVQDCNPLYETVEADKNGIMKLYLVLIKSKQDELKSLQPLKPFRPWQDMFGMPDKNNSKQTYPLHPKQLIQKYQLDKSQLAFTFCALSSDGQTKIPEWNTTVYSTVLTEISNENHKKRIILCPCCDHSFDISLVGDDDDCVQETINDTTIAKQNKNGKVIRTTKKQKLT